MMTSFTFQTDSTEAKDPWFYAVKSIELIGESYFTRGMLKYVMRL